jgi:AraC-like DNA-binding protein
MEMNDDQRPPIPVLGKTGNRQVLEDFIAEIERISGLRICIYDLNLFISDSKDFALKERHQFHNSSICELMKSRPESLARCIKTENQRAANSVRHPNGHVHRCYAGVSDFILPLQVHDRHLGAILIGQTESADPGLRQTRHCEIARKYGFTMEELKRESAKMKTSTPRELSRSGRIAVLLKDYVERVELLLSLENEYHIHDPYNARTAEEAVRKGQMPMRVLNEMRARLSGASAEALRKAIDLIQAKFMSKLSQLEVARTVGMSVSHFSREFHKQTGCTFRGALMETRLSAAFFLTKKYGITVAEAAYLVGYSDEFTFRRAFRALRGMSLTVYMRKYPRALDLSK